MTKHNFGTVNKKTKQKRPLSNFSFALEMKVVGNHPSSTGYLVRVTPECVEGDLDTTSRYHLYIIVAKCLVNISIGIHPNLIVTCDIVFFPGTNWPSSPPIRPCVVGLSL